MILNALRRAHDLVLDGLDALARVRKAAVPVVTSALAVLAIVLGADSDIVLAVTAIATTLGVYQVKNAR